MPGRFYHKRIVTPILGLLKQGISPEKIAMSMSSGIIMGLFPIVGITSLLCIVTAFFFRLNQTMTQLFNWLVYPLQIVLIIPFFRLGSSLFHAEPITVTVRHVIDSYRADFWGTIHLLGEITLHAAVVWLIICIPLGIILYLLFKPLLRKMNIGTKGQENTVI
jgi:uncharacterized protein (DUF2062 family)